jgi:1,4-alpha-glucan branching enzyme
VRADIRSVAVVGDFNDWSPTATPMRRDGGRFCTTVRLTAGYRYRYQFLVDGERLENDWAADDYEETDRGAYVSVIDLTAGVSSHRRCEPVGGDL